MYRTTAHLRVEHHVRVRDGVVICDGDAGGGAPPLGKFVPAAAFRCLPGAEDLFDATAGRQRRHVGCEGLLGLTERGVCGDVHLVRVRARVRVIGLGFA